MKRTNLIVLIPLFALLGACGGDVQPGPHEHNWASTWTSDETEHWHICTGTDCEEISDKSSHEFAWVVDLQPTFESKGSKHEECTVCGYAKESVEIDQLVHSYSSNWSSDNSQHWHSCTDEGYEDKEYGSDINNHSFDNVVIVEPTYDTAGSKTRGTCSICGESFESYVIPALNEIDYTRTCTNTHGKTLTETWTLKDPSLIGESSYVVTKTFKSGFVTVNDKSSGAFVRTDYTPYSFNKTFDGIEMSFDEINKELVVNVTKEGGYTFNDACLNFPSEEGNTITITGEPLVINAPNGTTYDGLGFDGSTNLVSDMCHAVIDTDVSVIYSDSYAVTTKSGLKANFFNLNEGASFTTCGFKYGVMAQYKFTINGLFDVSGTDLAMKSNNSNSRTIDYGKNLVLYFDDEYITRGADTTTTSDIAAANVKHLNIVPVEPLPESIYPYDYTIMLYMCGSDLEAYGRSTPGYATKDLKEILSSSSENDEVRFIVETGGVYGDWSLSSSYLEGATFISNTALQRWEVDNGKLKLIETLDTNEMATQESFESFLKWGLEDYSAEKMGVILWNHGGGINGVCFDDNSNDGDSLVAHEVNQATANALEAYDRDKFTWIGYDACLMACADVASANCDYYDYMICSQENEPSSGWAYNKWVPSIYNDSQVKDSVLFKNIVTSYNEQFTTRAYSTLSCLDLTKCDAFVDEFENYSKEIVAEFPIESGSDACIEFFANNIGAAFEDSEQFGIDDDGSTYGLADFKDFITNMETYFPTVDNTALLEAFNDMVLYNGCSTKYTWTPCGLNIFVAWIITDSEYPLQAEKYKGYNTENGTKLKTWADMNCDYSTVPWISTSI